MSTAHKLRITAKPLECQECFARGTFDEMMKHECAPQPAPDAEGEPWRDVGGHEWHRHATVECVECPHCCFVFAAVHTDGNTEGYSCPNCEGCPEDDAAPSDTEQVVQLREALEPLVTRLTKMMENGPDCECEPEGHTCGWPALQREVKAARAALQPKASDD